MNTTLKSLLILLTVLVSIPVLGQKHFVGVIGGASWTNLSDPLNISEYRLGFTGGLTYEYAFKNRLQLGLGFIYAQKGCKYSLQITDPQGVTIEELNVVTFYQDYISMPIKGGFSIGNKLGGFFNVGVIPSLSVNAKTTYSETYQFPKTVIDETGNATKFDFGGLIEVGGSYKLNEQWFLFTSFMYQYSFTNASNEKYLNTFENNHYVATNRHNYGMTISLGVKYQLK